MKIKLNFCIQFVSGENNREVDVKRLHGICMNLLDMVYLQYTEVYDRLHQLAVAGSPITNKDRYITIRLN